MCVCVGGWSFTDVIPQEPDLLTMASFSDELLLQILSPLFSPEIQIENQNSKYLPFLCPDFGFQLPIYLDISQVPTQNAHHHQNLILYLATLDLSKYLNLRIFRLLRSTSSLCFYQQTGIHPFLSLLLTPPHHSVATSFLGTPSALSLCELF